MSSRFVSAGGDEVKAPEGLSNVTDDAWEKARKQVDQARKLHENTGPAPGTQEGGKSLYEHLQAQKAAKQEAFEEATKLRNQFRPLDEAEVEFLEGIKQKERSDAASVRKETAEQLDAFRKERAVAEQLAQEEPVDAPKDVSDQWTTSKKRRRLASDDKPQPGKIVKASPSQAKTEDDRQGEDESTKRTSNNAAQTETDMPTSSLVAYDSDSDG